MKTQKLRAAILPLLLFSAGAWGQTVTVTANLKTIFAANQATKAKACFTLVDASTGQAVADPHITGTGVLVATDNICIAPDANGLISTTMYANSAIVVQGVPDTTYWSVQFLYNGSPTHGALYHFAGTDVTEDLAVKSPATLSPSVTPTPSDGTYMRVDAGNSPATGTWQFPAITVTGTSTGAVFNATSGFRVAGAATNGRFLKGDGTNFGISSGAASGSGSPTSCTNQAVTAFTLNSDAAPTSTCTTITPAFATGNTTGSGNFVLATGGTLSGPVINGTPTGTGIPTLTLKKGTGLGNYNGTNTSFADVDATNLAYTVTIPTGWKLSVHVDAVVFITTATTSISLAILDTSVIHENQITGVLNSSIQSTLGWVINGDGASHTVKLQAKTGAGADAWNIFNDTATRVPTMTFLLTPSN